MSTQSEANLNRTLSIGAIQKIWKMRFMVPYSVFMGLSGQPEKVMGSHGAFKGNKFIY